MYDLTRQITLLVTGHPYVIYYPFQNPPLSRPLTTKLLTQLGNFNLTLNSGCTYKWGVAGQPGVFCFNNVFVFL